MRFEVRETVPTPDCETVLRVLEGCLRDVSTEIVRKEQQITFYGLGPSPRSVNPHDTTVIFADVENNQTILEAYVMFQASALLGETAQDEVVRLKIDQIFQQMKTQLDMQEMSGTHSYPPVETLYLPVAEPELAEPETAKSETAEPEIVQPWSAKPEPAEPESPDDEPLEEAGMLDAPQPLEPLEAEPLAEPELGIETQLLEPISGAPARSRFLVASICAVAVVLLIAGAFLLRTHYRSAAPRTVAPKRQAAVTHDQSSKSGSDIPIVTTEAAVTAPHSGAQFDLEAADPKVWLQQWVAAMRTRDAVAQAAFYADPVERYKGQANVSRDEVLKEKQAAIADRRGLWTLKVENVVVERLTNSEVQVRFAKHFIDQPAPSEIWERVIRTQLTLKKVEGSWRIASEEDLP
jgi:hypothetical protein